MRHNFRSTATALLFALAANMVTSSASAGNTDPEDQAPHMAINLEKIDLTTSDGLHAARRQVSFAARAVCTGIVDVDGLPIQRNACVLKARAQGDLQLDSLHRMAMASKKIHAQYAYKSEKYESKRPN